MKFRIWSTEHWNINDIIEHYPCLTKFGFDVEKEISPKKVLIRDENDKPMEFEYGCDVYYTPYVHISTLEELLALRAEVECELIIMDNGEPAIEIYDGYRE
jgi:hypothetical protein